MWKILFCVSLRSYVYLGPMRPQRARFPIPPTATLPSCLTVVTEDLLISPRFSAREFLSRCKSSTLTARQLIIMVEFCLLAFSRWARPMVVLDMSMLHTYESDSTGLVNVCSLDIVMLYLSIYLSIPYVPSYSQRARVLYSLRVAAFVGTRRAMNLLALLPFIMLLLLSLFGGQQEDVFR